MIGIVFLLPTAAFPKWPRFRLKIPCSAAWRNVSQSLQGFGPPLPPIDLSEVNCLLLTLCGRSRSQQFIPSTSAHMTTEADDQFYERADAHIHIANDQTKTVGRGKVSASLMYATARFNSWISACKAESGDDLLAGKEEIIEYFVEEYRKMLDENLNDYIKNFDKYMGR
jgi:hypothetical protein